MKHKVINMERSTLIILAAVCIILFIAPLVMYSGLGEDEGYFGGSDDAASEQIEASNYEPWFSSIWEPNRKFIIRSSSSYRSNHYWLLLRLLERTR